MKRDTSSTVGARGTNSAPCLLPFSFLFSSSFLFLPCVTALFPSLPLPVFPPSLLPPGHLISEATAVGSVPSSCQPHPQATWGAQSESRPSQLLFG